MTGCIACNSPWDSTSVITGTLNCVRISCNDNLMDGVISEKRLERDDLIQQEQPLSDKYQANKVSYQNSLIKVLANPLL